MIKKVCLIGICALVLSGCTDDLFNAVAKEPAEVDRQSRPAKIATAKKVAITLNKSFPGVTEAARTSVLAFRVGGQIVDLPVRSGQALKAGDLIARLDETPYANVVADRKAKYDLAKIQLERSQSLYEKKHVAKASLDASKSNFAAAEVALKMAKEDLGYTRLTAPYDGIVAKIDVEKYQNTQASAAIVTYQGNKNIDIVFNIPETFLLIMNPRNADVKPIVSVVFDAFPERVFPAIYKEHEALPDATTRSFKATVTMPLPEGMSVLPGMSVNVRLDLAKIANLAETTGVLVPLESVFEEAGKRWVWKLDDEDKALKTEVEVQGVEDGAIRLRSGIEDGDRVVAVGVSHVVEGQKLRPYAKERGL